MAHENDHRITAKHLARDAIIYVRQSSSEQVVTNTESTRLQRELREKAILLGWNNPVIIDDDLGISAAGYSERPGFQSLLASVATRKVGIIFCLEASRLSRNSMDWAHLFELCSFFDTLIADPEQIYDLSLPNDRLVMGIKGTVSEMELSILKTRLQAGVQAKAQRGELRIKLPPGYKYDSSDKIDLDPDVRIQQALRQMFQQFKICTSIRQLAMWYRDTKTLFPIANLRMDMPPTWRIPTSDTLRKLLVHPIYAGAYVYGRRHYYVDYVDGQLRKRIGGFLPPEKCRVCIRNHHPDYLPWDQFKANLARISENRPRWEMLENQGAIRDGLALLAGLLRCGMCGSKIYVGYKKDSALYSCDGDQANGSRRCQSFGSKLIDRRVGEELCRALEPFAVDAAIEAIEKKNQQKTEEIEAARLGVEAAQYASDRAFEQFDRADPKNRLVADTLEKRLNERLIDLQEARNRLEECRRENKELTEKEKNRLHELACDFPAVWNDEQTDPTLKKRLLRTAVEEILVSHKPEQQQLQVTIHWKGGAHTRIHVKKRSTPKSCKADPDLVELVRKLAASGLVDAEIARILKMQKRETPRGLPWTHIRVRDFRRHHRIKAGKKDSSGKHLNMSNAAAYLGISHNGLIGLERIRAISRNQVTDFAPWRIPRTILDSKLVQGLVAILKETGRLPKGGCPKNQTTLFDEK